MITRRQIRIDRVPSQSVPGATEFRASVLPVHMIRVTGSSGDAIPAATVELVTRRLQTRILREAYGDVVRRLIDLRRQVREQLSDTSGGEHIEAEFGRLIDELQGTETPQPAADRSPEQHQLPVTARPDRGPA